MLACPLQCAPPCRRRYVIAALQLLTGFALIVADAILSCLQSTRAANSEVRWLYYCFPTYCLGTGFRTLALRSAVAVLELEFDEPSLFAWDALGLPLASLALEGAALVVLTQLLQRLSASPWLWRRAMRTAPPATAAPHPLEDETVVAEREAVGDGALEPPPEEEAPPPPEEPSQDEGPPEHPLREMVLGKLGRWYMANHGVTSMSMVEDMRTVLIAYWGVAAKRITENVCMLFENHLLAALGQDIEKALLLSLIHI
mgnify:CR=1 FL=1